MNIDFFKSVKRRCGKPIKFGGGMAVSAMMKSSERSEALPDFVGSFDHGRDGYATFEVIIHHSIKTKSFSHLVLADDLCGS